MQKQYFFHILTQINILNLFVMFIKSKNNFYLHFVHDIYSCFVFVEMFPHTSV